MLVEIGSQRFGDVEVIVQHHVMLRKRCDTGEAGG
jgi:hypothetical protein